MGNLLFYSNSFVFTGTAIQNRQALDNFLKAGKIARENGDRTYYNNDIHNFNYSWGKFVQNFALAPWDEISQNSLLSWVPQSLHQILNSFFYQNPSAQESFDSFLELEKKYTGELNGELGCDCSPRPSIYVSCISTWHLWRINFYQNNQAKYPWKKADNNFFPNNEYSNNILKKELEFHNKLDKIKNYNNDISLAFHNEVMRFKGSSLKAYSIQMTDRITSANFYKYEKELSDNESAASNNSYRRIYSLIGRNKNVQYISLDSAHGMFEFHDNKGNHLGEYRFDGGFNSGPQPSHNLKTI